MFFSSSLVVMCLALNALAYPLEVVEAENGEAVALVPLSRVRRGETYYNADLGGNVIVGVRGTPIDTETHRLDTDFFATTNVNHHSPITKGLEASYQHVPTNSNFDITAEYTPQYGTDLKASGKYNFYQDKTTNANIEGFYERQASGLSNHGFMLNLSKDF